MSKKTERKFCKGTRFHIRSLTGKLVVLLLFAAMVSCSFFWLANMGVETGLNVYFDKSSYLDKREKASVLKFQEFVIKNSLTPLNEQEISEWVKKQKVIYLEIYRDHRLLYDSLSSTDTNSYGDEAVFPEYEGKYYQVTFADGAADVRLYGVFEYQYYVYAVIAEILVSFLIFLALFIYGVKKGILYIQKIQSEICVMEGGCMDQEVTVSGEDELAQLAWGLEKMRLSLKQNMEEERKLRQANQWLITGIAHDLRTPLTSLTVYVEILQSDICRDDKKRRYYLDKIMKKAVLIKELSNQLFESCQVKTENEIREYCPTGKEEQAFDREQRI